MFEFISRKVLFNDLEQALDAHDLLIDKGTIRKAKAPYLILKNGYRSAPLAFLSLPDDSTDDIVCGLYLFEDDEVYLVEDDKETYVPAGEDLVHHTRELYYDLLKQLYESLPEYKEK